VIPENVADCAVDENTRNEMERRAMEVIASSRYAPENKVVPLQNQQQTPLPVKQDVPIILPPTRQITTEPPPPIYTHTLTATTTVEYQPTTSINQLSNRMGQIVYYPMMSSPPPPQPHSVNLNQSSVLSTTTPIEQFSKNETF